MPKKHDARLSHIYFAMSLTIMICFALLSGAAWPSHGSAPPGGGKPGAAQDESKLVRKSSYPNEPIKVVKVKGKRGDIPLGKKFKGDADAEWLRGFTITVENTSGKTITHMRFALLFPVAGNRSTGDLSYTFDLMYGVSPSSEHYDESRKRRPDRI